MYLPKHFVNSQVAFASRLNFGAIICWSCTIAAWGDGDPETLLVLLVSHPASFLVLAPYVLCFKKPNTYRSLYSGAAVVC